MVTYFPGDRCGVVVVKNKNNEKNYDDSKSYGITMKVKKIRVMMILMIGTCWGNSFNLLKESN